MTQLQEVTCQSGAQISVKPVLKFKFKHSAVGKKNQLILASLCVHKVEAKVTQSFVR